MSLWDENPEWFDEWLEQRALEGEFGEELKQQAQAGEFVAYEQWDGLDIYGSLGARAEQDFWERLVQ